MIRRLDTPWNAGAHRATYLSSTELLVTGTLGVAVRSVPGGELVKMWMKADAERSVEEWASAVVDRAADRVVVAPPRPAGLACVAADAPEAIAAELVVCSRAGEVVGRLANTRFSAPVAMANGIAVVRGPYESGVWDARSGQQRHALEDTIVAASPACEWILVETRDDEGDAFDSIELRVVSTTDLRQRWKRKIAAWKDNVVAAFVDENRVVIGNLREGKLHAELLDARGRTIAKLPHSKPLEDIRVVGDRVWLLSDTYRAKSQRILVATASNLRLVRDQTTKPVVALAHDGTTAVMREATMLATYDTSELLGGTKLKAAKKKPAKKPTKPRVHNWFFGVPRSVTVETLLHAGRDVHHMLDSPLRDLCIIIQPDDQVRELRWFAFVARQRKRPYEYEPWIDTLADVAPLLVAVLHDELSIGTIMRGNAYVDNRRTPAMKTYSYDGRTVVDGRAVPASTEVAPTLLLRKHAPNEPSDQYLTTLEGTVYRYANGPSTLPKRASRTFAASLRSPIDRA